MLQLLNKSLIELEINGDKRQVLVRPADTLLEVLRNQLGLTGAKPSCENGDCGACTVHIDGMPIKSCLMLAVEAIGHQVTTIEGLKNEPIQQAFVDCFSFQCGCCTSGFIMNAKSLITHHPDAEDYIIEEWLQSNVCRCTGYEEIKDAVKSVLPHPPSENIEA